jgi:hypothetical protein
VSDKSSSSLVDVLIGLLVAGVLAPAVLALPERFQGSVTLWTVAALCVGGVLLIRYVLEGRNRPDE